MHSRRLTIGSLHLCLSLLTGIAGIGCHTSAAAPWRRPVLDRRNDPALASGRDLLDSAEISATRAYSAYDAVARLRPEFLRHRSGPAVVVYLDEMQAGGLEVLRVIPVRSVKEIRWVDPPNARIRYGVLGECAVISVRTS
jgi:hypothetical protein